MDYFDDPSQRPRKKRAPARIYSPEDLEGLRRAAEISRARWRAEMETKDQKTYEVKRSRPRRRKQPENGAAERAKFAAALARTEFRRAYWNGEQEARLREAMRQAPKAPPGTRKKGK